MRTHLFLELLEDRALLAVQFTAAPYAVPDNRPDVPLGTIGSFAPIEPAISLNPRDPGNIVPSSHNGIRVSTNAGGTFTPRTLFPQSNGGDTTTTFDGAGRLFWVNIASPGLRVTQIDPTTGAVITSFPISSSSGEDKPWIAANTNTNELYVIWTRFSGPVQVLLSRSTDQGATWSAPLRLDVAGDNFPWPPAVSVDSATGYVYASYHAATCSTMNNPCDNSGRIVVVRYNHDLTNPVRSIPLGTSDADITFNVQTSGSARKIPGMQFWTQGAGQPWVLPDPTRPGHVYTVAADSNNFANDWMDVRIVRSTDYGLTWGTPTFVDAGPNASAQMFPTAAIDQFGNIVVAYYDNRRGLTNPAGRFKLDFMARYSTDGGATWSPAFLINEPNNPFDPDPGAVNRFSGPPPTTRIGEYFGVGLFAGTAYAVWNGNTYSSGNPVGHQVYYDAFAIRGALTVTGTAANDLLVVRSVPGNAAFVEVLVNGDREYAGLWSALTNITVNGQGGDDIFYLEETVAGTAVVLNGGTGTNYLFGSYGNIRWSILDTDSGTLTGDPYREPVGFTQIGNLLGGTGDDTFAFADGQALTGFIGGGTGRNKLDYSGWTSHVLVHLPYWYAIGTWFVYDIQDAVGGNADDLLVGNNASNVLEGGAGRDFLIGGGDNLTANADFLVGGGGDDLLLAGWTDWDLDFVALYTIFFEWSRTDLTYAQRADSLYFGSTGYALNEQTVHANHAPGGNGLFGGTELDLFYGIRDLDANDWDTLTERFYEIT